MTIETGMHYPLRLDALPSRWRVGYVGDFTKTIEPGFASGEHNAQGTGVPHLRPMNVNRDGKLDFDVVKYVAKEKDKRRLAFGDVLFNNTNSSELVGKTAVVNKAGDLAFSNHMTRITFGDDVLPQFGAMQLHFLWMRGYFRYNCVKHVNQASVSSKTLAGAVPFVWAPLDEQERIVAEIEKQFSRLDKAISNLKRVKANLRRYRTTVLEAAFDHEPNSRIGDLIESGPQNGLYLPKSSYGQGVSILRIDDYQTDWLRSPADLRRVAASADQIAMWALREGDLVINRVNSMTHLGKCVSVPPSLAGCLFESNMMRLSLRRTVLPRYVELYLGSGVGKKRLTQSAKWAVNQASINQQDVRATPVYVPDMDDQLSLVAEVDRRLSLVHEVEAEVDTNLKRGDRLRQSVLRREFKTKD